MCCTLRISFGAVNRRLRTIKHNISILCCFRNWFPISSTRFTSVSAVNLVKKEVTEMLVIVQKWLSLFDQDGALVKDCLNKNIRADKSFE